jgi:hypothetical protein
MFDMVLIMKKIMKNVMKNYTLYIRIDKKFVALTIIKKLLKMTSY